MTRIDEIQKYIDENRELNRDSLVKQLRNAGYRDYEIEEAIAKSTRLPSDSHKTTQSSTAAILLTILAIAGVLSFVIYGFMDFGSLVPNKIELGNNLRASPTESFANSQTQEFVLVFTYNGAKRVEMEDTGSSLESLTGVNCESYKLMNVDTGTSTGDVSTGNWEINDSITFLNGQTGVMHFKCSNLVAGETLEGELKINVFSVKTGISVPSTGPVRMTII